MTPRLIIAAALVAFLAACKIGEVEAPAPKPVPATAETAVAQTVKICDFLPDLIAVADLISASQEVKTAEAIAKMICNKFLTLAPSKTATPGVAMAAFDVEVNGKTVPIKGWAILR